MAQTGSLTERNLQETICESNNNAVASMREIVGNNTARERETGGKKQKADVSAEEWDSKMCNLGKLESGVVGESFCFEERNADSGIRKER